MDEQAIKAAQTPMGVIKHPVTEGIYVCYERVNDGYRAVEFGTGIPLGISEELLAAIEADYRKQIAKAKQE